MGMHTSSSIKQGCFPKVTTLSRWWKPLFHMLIYTLYCLMFDFVNLVGISMLISLITNLFLFWLHRILVPWPGDGMCPLQWKSRVVITGTWGSPQHLFKCLWKGVPSMEFLLNFIYFYIYYMASILSGYYYSNIDYLCLHFLSQSFSPEFCQCYEYFEKSTSGLFIFLKLIFLIFSFISLLLFGVLFWYGHSSLILRLLSSFIFELIFLWEIFVVTHFL